MSVDFLLKIIAVILILLVVLAIAVYAWIYFKYKFILDIKSKTIHMQKPLVLSDNIIKRRPVIASKLNEDLISKENISRRAAYKNTIIKTGESFFDDSDMPSDYYLVVVYDKTSNVPLLTARYFYGNSVIARSLKGDGNAENVAIDLKDKLDLTKIKEGDIFLADRLSGNTSSIVYRHYRDYIFILLYIEMLIRNKNSKFILMARKEKDDKLLKKYLKLWLTVIGSTAHKGKEHWILLGDMKTTYSNSKKPIPIRILLLSKNLRLYFNKN
jgi:hypothetical protein